MAIYDPSLDVTEALNIGFTRMTLFNANSISSINLNLAYRQKPSGEFAYDYDYSILPPPLSDLIAFHSS